MLPTPLLFVQGLGAGGSPGVGANSPEPAPTGATLPMHRTLPVVTAALAVELAALIQNHHVHEAAWHPALLRNRAAPAPCFHVRFVANTHALPTKSEVSPLSPFAKNADPHALLPAAWFAKYTRVIPAVLLAVYELPESSDEALVAEIDTLQKQLAAHGTRLVPLLVLAQPADAAADAQVAALRKQTQLGLRLLFLPAGSRRELEVLVEVMMGQARTAASEFYTAVERRVRKRKLNQHNHVLHSPMVLLTLVAPASAWSMAHLEARQSTKLAFLQLFRLWTGPSVHDTVVRQLDTAYRQVLQVVVDSLGEGGIWTAESWDNPRWLLDSMSFNLARLHLALEFPGVAYSTFDAHLNQCYDVLLRPLGISARLPETLVWLSGQVQRLAELVGGVSVGGSENPVHDSPENPGHDSPENPGHNSSEAVVVAPYGSPPMDWSRLLVPDSVGLVGILSMPHPGFLFSKSYSLLARSGGSHDEQLLRLLEAARMCFGPLALERGAGECFPNAVLDTWFRTGEIHARHSRWARALAALEHCGDRATMPPAVRSAIGWRRFQCCVAEGLTERAAGEYLRLCTVLGHAYPNDMSPKGLLGEVAAENAPPLVAVAGVFRSHQCELGSTMTLQVTLTSTLRQGFSPAFTVDRVEVPIGEQVFVLEHGEGGFEVEATPDHPSTTDLSFGPDTSVRTVHLTFTPLTTGEYSIGEVTVYATATLPAATLKTTAVSALAPPLRTGRYEWHALSHPYPVVANPRPHVVEVAPRHPDVRVELASALVTAFHGETYPMRVFVDNRDGREVHALVEVALDHASATAVWGASKTPVLTTVLAVGASEHLALTVQIPTVFREPSLQLTLTVQLAEDAVAPHTTDTFHYTIPVVSPFKAQFANRPAIHAEDLLLPFGLDPDAWKSIPVGRRLWVGRMELRYDAVDGDEVEVVSHRLVVKSQLEEVVVAVMPTGETTPSVLQPGLEAVFAQQFSTRPAEGALQVRSVAVECSMEVQWRRDAQGPVNMLHTPTWRVQLPLADPRVMLELVRPALAEAPLTLVYTIENPTLRVFRFATTFLDYTSGYRLVGRGLGLALVQVLVLPFTRLRQVYTVAPVAKATEMPPLPELKVYDVNYKVTLPTLVASDDLELRDGRVYLA